MPIFDYKCNYCGTTKEVLLHKTDSQEPMCSECEQKMVRLLSSPGLLKTNFHDKPSVKAKQKNSDQSVTIGKQRFKTPVSENEVEWKYTPRKG